jgi:hypothetical protein
MNTPPNPKRYSSRQLLDAPNFALGIFKSGLHDAAVSSALGQVLSNWTHVEEAMIDVMAILLGGQPQLPARQIFRAINNNYSRIVVLTSLLEKAPINSDKSAEYDEIIREFKRLNTIRNKFAHGLWSTGSSGAAFLAEPTAEDFSFMARREVKLEEINEAIESMRLLQGKISTLWQPILDAFYAELDSERDEPA